MIYQDPHIVFGCSVPYVSDFRAVPLPFVLFVFKRVIDVLNKSTLTF